jgi:hypothetical protein
MRFLIILLVCLLLSCAAKISQTKKPITDAGICVDSLIFEKVKK